MRGGERRCSKCVHGQTLPECDVRSDAEPTWRTMGWGGRYCGLFEREPIASRAVSAAKRMAGEWPKRKAVER